jgi:hypothetical protein
MLIKHFEYDRFKGFTGSFMNFDLYVEFLQWKQYEYESEFAYFFQALWHTQSWWDNIYISIYIHFACQHDGSQKLHVDSDPKSSFRNCKGRAKLGLNCPARLLVKQDCRTNSVAVRCIASHSHALTFENTQFQPMQ